MNFIKRNEQAFIYMGIGLLLSGFIYDVKWKLLAHAVGVL